MDSIAAPASLERRGGFFCFDPLDPIAAPLALQVEARVVGQFEEAAQLVEGALLALAELRGGAVAFVDAERQLVASLLERAFAGESVVTTAPGKSPVLTVVSPIQREGRVEAVLAGGGPRTPDLGGKANTVEVGDAIAEAV